MKGPASNLISYILYEILIVLAFQVVAGVEEMKWSIVHSHHLNPTVLSKNPFDGDRLTIVST